jgi:cytochrome P450
MSHIIEARDLDLTSPVFKANPFPTFAHLRLTAPVARINAEEGQHFWLITRYQEAEFVLRDERFVKNRRHAVPGQEEHTCPPSATDLVTMGLGKYDPPDHTRLRSLLSLSFTPRLVEQWRERIQQITDELIDAREAQGSMDVVEDIAFPLPLAVIAEMLGIPEEDRLTMDHRIRLIVEALGNPAALQRVNEELQACYQYLLRFIERKRREPTDDLVSSLLQVEAAGDRLSERELVAMVYLLIMAGYETTGTMISNGILALLTHPEQMTLLRDNPALSKTAIEEFLRYRSPLMLATMRWARTDMHVGGQLIRQGDQVVVSLAAANRDAEIFSQAEQLDIARTDNHHLAFSKGIHYCLGAALARLEGQIAINTLLRRLPELRLQIDPGELTWRPGSMVLGLAHLPVVFRPPVSKGDA